MTSHYETLGVPPDASEETIKKAYRRARAKAHPDREGGDHSQMQLVQRAWETLSDPQKRERYDHTGEDGSGSEPSVEQRAQQVFSQMLDEWLESEQFVEPLKTFNASVARVKSKIAANLTEARKKLVQIDKRSKVLKRKTKGQDLFSFCVEQKRRAIRTEISNWEMEEQIAEEVTKILKDYQLGIEARELEEMLERAYQPRNPYTDLEKLFTQGFRG
jgi:curved DNA-binding protein CbpA